MTSASKMIELCRPLWDEMASQQIVARLWRRDHTLWKPSPEEISNRLGWLELPNSMRDSIHDIARFARETRDRGVRHVVLLGMGGSSLGAEVLARALGTRRGFPTLTVLDSTIPAVVRRTLEQIDLSRSLFIVASKSGTTAEVSALYAFFRAEVEKVCGEEAGRHFVAITDPGTPLLTLAHKARFLRAFINPADVGGRYSVLSYFGLVPAALMGLDVGQMLLSAREAARLCGNTDLRENPGAWLGMCMGCLASNGRDKMTLFTSPRLGAFGLWAEQLIAESTGKEGLGIVPVVGEPTGVTEAYGDDRYFVYLRLAGDENKTSDDFAKALNRAGLPLIRIELKEPMDLAGEFFRWEFAVAVAAACLKINPFDQPNVQESKSITAEALALYEKQRTLPPVQTEGSLPALLESRRKGDYLALMVFSAPTDALDRALDDLRLRLLIEHKLATTLGYGPRFLHSTGQLHKGGADNVLCVQVVSVGDSDLPVPGKGYGFRALATAQALGDYGALKAHGRRTMRLATEDPVVLPALVRGLLENRPTGS